MSMMCPSGWFISRRLIDPAPWFSLSLQIGFLSFFFCLFLTGGKKMYSQCWDMIFNLMNDFRDFSLAGVFNWEILVTYDASKKGTQILKYLSKFHLYELML